MTTAQNEFSLRSLLKSIIVDWFLSSTAHALPNIFRTGSVILKIIWLCCFIASGTYCIYSVGLSLKDFLSYPSYISTKMVQEIPAQFPAVTICNLKTVNKVVANAYISVNVPYLVPYFKQQSLDETPFEFIIARRYVLRTITGYDQTISNNDRKNFGYKLEDMLYGCYFNYLPCNVSDFIHFYDSLLGNCYTFNKGTTQNDTVSDVKTVSVPGSMYGLILELFLGEPTVETEYEHSDGVLISVHNQSSAPFTEESKIVAATGADTDIGISRNFVSKLDKPYGNCLKDVSRSSKFSSLFFDHIVRTLGVTYTHGHCFALCLQQEVINQCNCSNTFLPNMNNNVLFCYFITEVQCLTSVINTFGEKKNVIVECEKACPFSCDYIQYDASILWSQYPTKFYKKLLAREKLIQASNISYDDIDKAVAKVNVFYKSMTYTSTEENVQTSTEAFFSNIGGTLGLYLGISLLSLVEVVELLFNLIFATYNYKKQARQVAIEPLTTNTDGL